MNPERAAAIERLRRFYPPTATKVCVKCQRDLPLEDFRRDRRRCDGHKLSCETCVREEARQRWARDHESYVAAMERWRAAHVPRQQLKAEIFE